MKKNSKPTFVFGTEGKIYACNRAARRMALATGMSAVHVPMQPLERIENLYTGEVQYRLNGVFPYSLPYAGVRR